MVLKKLEDHGGVCGARDMPNSRTTQNGYSALNLPPNPKHYFHLFRNLQSIICLSLFFPFFSSRLVEEYYRPTVVISLEGGKGKEGDKGSSLLLTHANTVWYFSYLLFNLAHLHSIFHGSIVDLTPCPSGPLVLLSFSQILWDVAFNQV